MAASESKKDTFYIGMEYQEKIRQLAREKGLAKGKFIEQLIDL